jgi:hypothetical protein
LSKETKGLLSVLAAILVTMLGFAFLAHLDLVVVNPSPLRLAPAIIGGSLFGVGMVLGGGCVAGSLYKAGEGRISSIMAVIGIALGAVSMRHGCMQSAGTAIDRLTRGHTVVGGLHQLAGSRYATFAGTLSVASLFLIVAFGRKALVRGDKLVGFSTKRLVRGEWPLLAGAIFVGVLEWAVFLLSTRGGRNYGIGVLGGVTSVSALLTGVGRISDHWDMGFVLGIPIGSAISAKMRGNLQLRSHEPSVLLVCFLGGLLTGAGAAIGRGCFIGNTITGVALLSVHSTIFTFCTLLANWATTACYIRGLS